MKANRWRIVAGDLAEGLCKVCVARLSCVSIAEAQRPTVTLRAAAMAAVALGCVLVCLACDGGDFEERVA